MEILQLPMLNLQERIDTEMESNPVLELQETRDENLPDTPQETDDTVCLSTGTGQGHSSPGTGDSSGLPACTRCPIRDHWPRPTTTAKR